jgi:hypothetical protein
VAIMPFSMSHVGDHCVAVSAFFFVCVVSYRFFCMCVTVFVLLLYCSLFVLGGVLVVYILVLALFMARQRITRPVLADSDLWMLLSKIDAVFLWLGIFSVLILGVNDSLW